MLIMADLTSYADDMALRLPNTTAGRSWLGQFDAADRKTATRVLASLTLVSHSAFERSLSTLILREAEKVEGPVALYATRELEPDTNYFAAMAVAEDPQAPHDAVARGADLGSEARIAAIIRNLCKADPERLLNHPSLETLRESRAKAVFTVDDIIGSGKRTSEFIRAMWHSGSVMSWHSRHQIRFAAIAYSGTEIGIRTVKALKCRPSVVTVRDCPTFDALPWHDEIGEAVTALCNRYGRRTSKPGMRLGFRKTMVALVFEHGCPNNAPSILWAPALESGWNPLFPDRTVHPESASAFPPDIMARNPVAILADLSDEDEPELPAAVMGETPLGMTTITVLALAAQGVRSRAALGYATGYDARDCGALLDRCVARGYLTATLRLTAAGRAELGETIRPEARLNRLPPRGEDAYHPSQLRGPDRG
jgi:hypothetical protein